MSKAVLYDTIEQYLAGNLSAGEVVAFELQLKEDPELHRELQLHQDLQTALADKKMQQLRSTLKAVDARWSPPAQVKSRPAITFYLMRAAAAIALLLLGYWFFQSPGPEKPEALFATHFKAYELVLNNRDAANDGNVLLNMAMQAYASEDYALAASAFGDLASLEPDHAAWPFYQAMSLLVSGNSTAARQLFTTILKQPANIFREQAQWYLAMCYLAEKDTANAVLSLQQIAPGAYQYTAAQNILEALK